MQGLGTDIVQTMLTVLQDQLIPLFFSPAGSNWYLLWADEWPLVLHRLEVERG